MRPNHLIDLTDVPAGLVILNNPREAAVAKITERRLTALHGRMRDLQAKIDAEQRGIATAEQTAELNRLFAEFQSLSLPLERQLIERGEALANDQPDHRPRVPAQPKNELEIARGGFRNFGEFAIAVRSASRESGGYLDPRLVANAPTSYGQEGTGADGGFAVPPDFRREIVQKVMGEDSLIARTDQLVSSSNSISIPKDETTPWQSSGGVQAYWENEAGQLNQSKPSLSQSTIKLNKLTALVGVTEELLEDAPALSSYLRNKAPQKMDFRVTDAIINGTGAGMPMGILNSAALVTVLKESAQPGDTVLFQNIVNMWSRMYSGCRQKAVWLVNQDVEPQLMAMQFPGSGTAVPVYLPPGGLAGAPFGTLLNRPVLPMEACPMLGDKGDIILADLSQYMSATRVGGIRVDVSMHLWFDYDMQAFRFILRVGGQPWWNGPIARKNGANTLSCFVTIEERTGGG